MQRLAATIFLCWALSSVPTEPSAPYLRQGRTSNCRRSLAFDESLPVLRVAQLGPAVGVAIGAGRSFSECNDVARCGGHFATSWDKFLVDLPWHEACCKGDTPRRQPTSGRHIHCRRPQNLQHHCKREKSSCNRAFWIKGRSWISTWLRLRSLTILLPARISARAVSHPNQVAVTDSQSQLTFGELDRKSNQLAWYLRNAGASPDSCVGLFFDRSVDFVVAALAVLKSGAAYLAMDSNTPTDRAFLMLNDAGTKFVLTHRQKARDWSAGTLACGRN